MMFARKEPLFDERSVLELHFTWLRNDRGDSSLEDNSRSGTGVDLVPTLDNPWNTVSDGVHTTVLYRGKKFACTCR